MKAKVVQVCFNIGTRKPRLYCAPVLWIGWVTMFTLRTKKAITAPAAAIGILLAVCTCSSFAAEQLVQNDSVVNFGQAIVLGDFVAGEEAAVRLTSPCNGNIVAVQVLWLENGSGNPASMEEAIRVYDGANFPTPGAELLFLEGPVLQSPAWNEFRYSDEGGTIPINVPVTYGQQFYVSLEFGNDTHVNEGSPSVVHDVDGCQAGKNALKEASGGWQDFCPIFILLPGDVAIRAVVDCPPPAGACCDYYAPCQDDVDEADCQGESQTFFSGSICEEINCPVPVGACCRGGGCLTDVEQTACEGPLAGVYAGDGTSCEDDVCVTGACCHVDGTCSEVFEVQCDEPGAIFNGAGTSCDPNPCSQPEGACCFGSYCQAGQTNDSCTGAGGEWAGAFTSCIPDLCPLCDNGDADGDGDVDLLDFAKLQECFNGPSSVACKCLDMDNDNDVDLADFNMFHPLLNSCGPQ